MKFNGLSDKEVEQSRGQYGSNEIPDSEPTTFWEEFKETFGDPMIKILLAIAALMMLSMFSLVMQKFMSHWERLLRCWWWRLFRQRRVWQVIQSIAS